MEGSSNGNANKRQWQHVTQNEMKRDHDRAIDFLFVKFYLYCAAVAVAAAAASNKPFLAV